MSYARGYTYTLLPVFDYVNYYMTLLSGDRKAYERWRVGRAGEMREWRKVCITRKCSKRDLTVVVEKHAFQLRRYLWELELEKEQKLKSQQEQRQAQ
ncbi:hypothetical protein FRC08_015243 [Ceratobasidium sp. 394]|nr:hypothetical protein FRC08_015243 [Ceratobasidium sp. 394]